jgi:hypothetical protein
MMMSLPELGPEARIGVKRQNNPSVNIFARELDHISQLSNRTPEIGIYALCAMGFLPQPNLASSAINKSPVHMARLCGDQEAVRMRGLLGAHLNTVGPDNSYNRRGDRE